MQSTQEAGHERIRHAGHANSRSHLLHQRRRHHQTRGTLHPHSTRRTYRTTSADTKHNLPWLKLAKFGDARTDKNSLRHNDNILVIGGIEGDADNGQVSFEAAVQLLRAAGIAALVYTSPSHAENAPRWRVLCPLSRDYPPDQRDRLMARLNGALPGVLANESWTLSQSYYYGSVNRNPSHQVVVIEGTCVDLADRLDATAIGKPEKPRANGNGQHGPASRPEDIADVRVNGLITALLDNVRSAPDGTKHHTLFDIGRTIGGYLSLIGWSEAEAVEQLVGALPASVMDWDAARKTAAQAVALGATQPLELEDRPTPHCSPPRTSGDGTAAPAAEPDEGEQPWHPRTEPPGWEQQHPPNDEPPLGHRPRRKRRTDEAPPYTPTDITDLWDPWDDPPPPAWPSAVLAPQVEDTLALMSLRDGIDIGTFAVTHVAASSAAAPKDARFFAYNNRATGWCVPPIFWPMIVGDSGFRKTILGQFFAPLRDVQATLWRPYAIAVRNWYAAPPNGRGPKPTEPHSFIVDDFTVEALQRILAATTRGSAVVTDELAGLFEFDRYR